MTADQSTTMSPAAEINDAAAEWLHKVDVGEIQEDDAGLRKWLDANPRHYVAYARLERSWTRAERLKALPAAVNEPMRAEALARNIDVSFAVGETAPSRWLPVSLAAVVLLSAVLGALWFYKVSWTDELYATHARETARIVQPDGSVIYLNAMSEARVRYSPFHRRVDLLKGEGFFAVAKEPRRPFDVHGAGNTVRAVGTEFDVLLRSESSIEVIVRSGIVALNPPSDQSLKAGGVATLTRESIRPETLDAQVLERKVAWHRNEGELRFEGETLANVVNELNRYNKRQIVISDSRFSNLRIGGLVDTSDPDRFVSSLHRVMGREVVRVVEPGN
jgi:transmembrane sensor